MLSEAAFDIGLRHRINGMNCKLHVSYRNANRLKMRYEIIYRITEWHSF